MGVKQEHPRGDHQGALFWASCPPTQPNVFGATVTHLAVIAQRGCALQRELLVGLGGERRLRAQRDGPPGAFAGLLVWGIL